MPRRRADGVTPSWSRLCRLASTQIGYFTCAQALTAGFSPQLLQYYIQTARVTRTHRGVFRLSQYPRGEDEDLIAVWLWARGEGVLSHHTALYLSDLTDVPPSEHGVTMPLSWRSRRLRPPPRSVIYYADVAKEEQVAKGPFQLTAPLRTLVDCIRAQIDARIIEQAIRHATRRKLLTRARLQRALETGGVSRLPARVCQ